MKARIWSFLLWLPVLAQAATDTYSTAGTFTWTAPAGVTSVTVEAWGGGGGGGAATRDASKGGGGAGGQYAKKVVTVTAGTNYAIVVGAGGTADSTSAGGTGGDSTFGATTVVAKGGAGGGLANAVGGEGAAGTGSTAGGVGDTVYRGGNGAAGATNGTNRCRDGGAGGGGAGSGGNGGDASGNTGGTGTASDGGAGGDAANSSGDGSAGSAYGGGGAGACAESNTDRSGGTGAAGKVVLTYAVSGGGGCTTSSVGSDTLVTCTGSGSITIPADVTSVRYLIVAGGGGGGGITSGISYGAGGGGAGGLLNGTSLAVTAGATYAVTVGTGGGGGVGGTSQGGTGGDSSFATLTAKGGGGGASRNVSDNGVNGGSGGGGRSSGTGGSGTAGQGNKGGNGAGSSGGAGGGGGAGAAGANGSGSSGGSGGAGTADDITGASVVYGAGGTGGGYVTRAAGTAGTANTGNGGSGASGSGSGSAYDGGAGGSGIVIIRYSPTTSLNCFTDSFTGTDGSSPGSNWTTTSSSGSFGLPKIYSNRLRLTDASGNVATAAHLQKLFPGAGNKIVVQFDYFAYNGTGADGIAVTLSDASVSPQAGAYGGSLGYAQKTGIDGFAGGWLGVGVDEYGNFANPTEGRSGGPGQIPDSVTVRGSGSGQTGYAYHATSNGLTPGVDQPGSTAGPGHRYRVTVDHTDGTHAYVQVERDTTGTGSSYSTLIPQYDAKAKSGQAAVPTNWLLSFTGSTGGSTNIHEIDNLSVCTTQPIIAAGLNHIRIEHTGSGVTCAPTTLTIKACADAACSSLYSGGVTGTLTATGTPTVNWVGGAGFTIDSTGSVTKQAQVVTAGTVTWSTTSVSPAPTSTTDCYVGAAASCAFTSALAGFLFDVPNHAADTSQTITVSAVKQADNSLACTPAFASVSKSVSFACGYSNPASGTLPVTVGGTAINCGTSAGVTLGFNATGVASTTVRYADVGQMTLTASYAGTSGSETGLAMTGSDSFIAAPASFTVAPGGPYVAGNPFSVTVTAKNASGGTTPNFGKESTTENVTLGHALVGPAGGNDPAQGGTTTLADASFQSGGGAASASDLTWAEVGDISLTATLASGSYLGSGLTATGAGAAGPFKPAYFETVVTPGAGTFTYSGQTFSVKATAKSAGGGTTKNYAGAYAKAVTLTDGNAATNSSGTLGSFSNAAIPAASFIAYGTDPVNAGTATVSNIAYTFTNKETAPLEAPGSAPLAMRATDTNSVTSSGHTEGTTPIRSGRLSLTNAYGAEQLSLIIPAEVQYFNGTFWATNTQDGSSTAGWTVSPSGTTALVGSGSTSLTLGASLTSGLASLAASAPGTGGSGYLDLAVAVPGYLNFPWGGCANMTAFPANCLPAEFVGPGARATFGIHRGDRRIIYRR